MSKVCTGCAEIERLTALLTQAQEALRAADKVVQAYTAESEDWNDGEFALWRKDDLVNAVVALRAALVAGGVEP